ncbi:hypothetical protein BHU72_00010 [Desulfuribacillus stibiiarsenatis]|uniref:SLH domain-containing protein n=1 Tax=Desulfuribacillus stibiiarsenatis TaxID=1390249 RepID=A0A1E5L9G5_9FIRM|nr:S-layer homology domain-containing protein [Desulfuribacillus stibiiarsenatis]OEH86698.1 hypothetical protein BHU72_00010 [Desulfuribacillus stibiiarsenatis]
MGLLKIHKVGLILLLALLFNGFTGAEVQASATVSELTVEQRLDIHFKDMQQAPWAESEIRKLTIRGVLGGFPDGTYRPNAPIKKVEAIVMAVRALGLEEDAKDFASRSDSLFYPLEGQGLEWARGYLRAAWSNGLITGYMQELSWYDPADRAWMAKLMVRTIRKEQQAIENRFPLYFQDRQKILPNQTGYINVVQMEGLMAGYPDNTFRPDATMTRAELAVLFDNYFEKYMNDYTLKKIQYATIEDFQHSSGDIIIRTMDKGLRKVKVNLKAPIFYESQNIQNSRPQKRSYSQLQKGQQISGLLYGEQLVFVTIQQEGLLDSFTAPTPDYSFTFEREQHIVGFLTDIDSNGLKLTFEMLSGQKMTIPYASNLAVTNLNGSSGRNSMLVGALYELKVDSNKITKLTEQESRRNSYTGDLVSINPFTSETMIRHSFQESKNFIIPEGLKPTFEMNDYIRVTAYGKYIFEYEILRPGSDEGYFVKYDSDRKEIYLTNRQGKEVIYSVIDNPRIQVSRISRPLMSDIYQDDYVRLSFDRYDQNNNRLFDEIINIQVVDQLAGTIISAGSSEIRFRDQYGLTREMRVATAVTLNIVNVRNATVYDLRPNDQASFRIQQGRIQQVNVYSRTVDEGIVFDIQDLPNGTKQLVLGESALSQKKYGITAQTRVSWHDFRDLSLREVGTGQYVRVWYDGPNALEIEIIDSGMVIGQLVAHSYNSIWLKASGISRTRFIIEQQLTSGLNALKYQTVQIVFRNGVVYRIDPVPVDNQEYVVVDYSSKKGTIWVRDSEGKHRIYWLSDDKVLFEGDERSIEYVGQQVTRKSKVKLQIVNEIVVAIRPV